MPAPGPLGRNLVANVEYLRQVRGLSLRKLSAGLEAIGRPIPPLGLFRLVHGERRVDVDELVALAEVLEVTPDVLLSPPGAVRAAPGPVPAVLREARNLVSRIEDLLEAADDPGGGADRALRRVQIELEELLDDRARPGAA